MRALPLFLLLLTAASCSPPSVVAAADAASTPTTLHAARLEEEKALDQVVSPPDSLRASAEKGVDVTREILSLVHKSTHVPLLVVTRATIPPKAVSEMGSHPVRDVLMALAKSNNGAWQKYQSILVLTLPGIEPHTAKPATLIYRFPELKRKITGVYAGGDIASLLRRLSYWNRVDLGIYARPGVRLGGAEVWSTPCTIAAEGTTVDDVMQALTAISGCPWDHDNLYHVLCLTGDALTDRDREALIPSKNLSAFSRSVSDEQVAQMKGRMGMPLAALSREQAPLLLSVIGDTLKQAGLDPNQAVLRVFGDQEDMIRYGQMVGNRFIPVGGITFR